MSVGKELAILFSVMFLPGLFGSTASVDPASWSSAAYVLAVVAVSIPQILLVVYVTNLRTPGFSKRIGWVKPQFRDVVSAFIAAGGILAAVGIWQGLSFALGISAEPSVEWLSPPPRFLPIILFASLSVGYREEIFYRAYLIERGDEHDLPRAAVVVVSSLLFAAGHVYQGVAGFAVSLLVGLALALVYSWRRSLHGVAFAHGVYNLVVLYSFQY